MTMIGEEQRRDEERRVEKKEVGADAIVKQVEEKQKKENVKQSMFMQEVAEDKDWDAFMAKRDKRLPVVHKVEHHGHHGGEHSSNNILLIDLARFIFRCNDTWKFWWDIWILILAVIICILLPFEIAYHPPFGT